MSNLTPEDKKWLDGFANQIEKAKKSFVQAAERILELSRQSSDVEVNAFLVKSGLPAEYLQWAKDYEANKLTADELAIRTLRALHFRGDQ